MYSIHMNEITQFKEIERKFLPRNVPFDLAQLPSVRCERYYLHSDGQSELRVQKKDDHCELEHKTQALESLLMRDSLKIKIPLSEWEALGRKRNGQAIIFNKYRLPFEGMSIKKYEGPLAGLLILECEFDTLDHASSFYPEEWMGEEISSLGFSRDSGLINYSSFSQFKQFLDSELRSLRLRSDSNL